MSLVPNSKYWFILGRESLIAAAELDAVLGLKTYDFTAPVLKTKAQIDAPTLMKQLGGTIKIAKEIDHNITVTELEKVMISELKTVPGKINFGISVYTTNKNNFTDLVLAKDLGKAVKKLLKADGLSVRYVENREAILSSVTVEKNNLTGRGREFLIQKNQHGGFSIAKTEAVQPFEAFGARDFGRPGRDDVSGMLPPKLAMMMINLAKIPNQATLLDPFCGSGTILSEALLLGYTNLIGTDISERAIHDTKKNMAWIANQFGIVPTDFQLKLQTEPIETIQRFLAPASIDAVIAEPYMGKPLKGRETKEELQTQAHELKKLFITAFSNFHKILSPQGVVVFLIHRFRYQNDWITIDCQKEITSLGFKAMPFLEENLPLVYARPEQRVAREIWRFKKN
jgi:tRNA G10  N-methylase Trm11